MRRSWRIIRTHGMRAPATARPSDINASNLTIAENSAIGNCNRRVQCHRSGRGGIYYEILNSFLSRSSPSLWLDAHMVDGSNYLETLTDDTFSNWIDLSGNSKNLRMINSSNVFREEVELAGNQKQYVSLSSNNGLVTDENISVRSVLVLHKSTTTGYFLDFRSGTNESYIYGPSVGSFWVSHRKNGITQSTVSDNILNNQLQISYLVGSQNGSGKFNLNSRFSNNEFGSSLIGEVLIFDRVLSSGKLSEANNIFLIKWDLNSLFPSNHFDES